MAIEDGDEVLGLEPNFTEENIEALFAAVSALQGGAPLNAVLVVTEEDLDDENTRTVTLGFLRLDNGDIRVLGEPDLLSGMYEHLVRSVQIAQLRVEGRLN